MAKMLKSVLDSKAIKLKKLILQCNSLEQNPSPDKRHISKTRKHIMDIIYWFDSCGYLNALTAWCSININQDIKYINIYNSRYKLLKPDINSSDFINVEDSKEYLDKISDSYEWLNEYKILRSHFKVNFNKLAIWVPELSTEKQKLAFNLAVEFGDAFKGDHNWVIPNKLINRYFNVIE